MSTSFFYMQAEKNQKNHLFAEEIESLCNQKKYRHIY